VYNVVHLVTQLQTDSTMTQEHPITPPPDELVEQWRKDNLCPENLANYVATQAARWGSDQELEACVNYVDNTISGNKARALRAIRRPKPPSLKEQAVFAAAVLRSPDETCSIAEIEQHWHTIRCALEALPE
jgi:hypothetical protein